MMDLERSHADRRKYERALGDTRAFYVTAHLLDADEKEIRSLTAPDSRILDGQVNVDWHADVKRSLSLTLLDPNHRFYLEPNSPRRTALHPGLMIRVVRHDYVPALSEYVDCPVFWGPLARFERRGNFVGIEAMGKEVLALAPRVLWRGVNIPKGTNVVDAIETIMRAVGERRFDLPKGITKKLPAHLSLTRHQDAWPAVKRLARRINRQLFYDGRGRLRLRVLPKHPRFTFYAVERPNRPKPVVLDQPQLTYEFGDMRNLIEVLGPEPAGRQEQIRATAKARRKDPLSPWSLSRNGEPAFVVETVENDKLKRDAEAQDLADELLEDHLRIAVDVRFSSLPIPHLEERDLCVLQMEDDAVRFRLDTYTIPLVPQGVMQVGDLRRPKLQRPHRRKAA
jgi:hypothetical protein